MPPLHRSAMAADPIEQFRAWYERAEREVPLANAMTLATVDADGAPDARMVLLKGFGPEGFRFFTNLSSARAASSNRPRAPRSCSTGASSTARSGSVARWGNWPDSESDEYFASRDRAFADRRLGLAAEPSLWMTAATLDERAREAEHRFSGAEIPRPPFWGGFVVRPNEVEFWQGQVARLHDRFRYLRTERGWRLERLAP